MQVSDVVEKVTAGVIFLNLFKSQKNQSEERDWKK